MNYSYGAGSSENFSSNNNHARMLENYETECYGRTNKSLYEQTTTSVDTMINNQFDCLINEASVNVDTIANENKNEEDILQTSSSSNSSSSSSFSYNMNVQNRYVHHNHSHQHQHHHHNQMHQQHIHQQNINQNYSFTNEKIEASSSNNINSDYHQVNKKCIKQDNCLNENTSYANEKNFSFPNENKFQYVLMAPTSPAVKTNEDTLTYLNQGQNYELRLSITDSISINNANISNLKNCNNFDNQINQDQSNANYLEDIKPLIINGKPNVNRNETNISASASNNSNNKFLSNGINDGKTTNLIYLSIIRLCFWDRKLQEIEHQEIKEWEKEYHNVRMLEIDSNSSYGTVDVRLSEMYTNAAEIIWNGNTGASIFFRCNCTSTAFAPHKHGGEKGIHMRFQIDTFEMNSNFNSTFNKSGTENLSVNCNQSDLQQPSSSILSPPNSSSSPIQTHKFSVKEDMEHSYSHQNIHQQQQLNQSSPITMSLPDYNNWLHACSSYCRIQLFRLKGAQRKLKTDRSKIEKLNPADLRRRYQPSSKITLLYNGAFDPLYSMMPPVACNAVDHNHRYHCHNHNYQDKLSSSVDNIHSLNGGAVVAAATGDYIRNSISANGSSFHLNNSLPSPSATSLYNPNGYAVGIQPYLVAPLQQHSQMIRAESNDIIQHQQQSLATLTTVQYNQPQSTNQMNDIESSFTPASVISNEEHHQFYFDPNNQSHYKLSMPEMGVQSNGSPNFMCETNNSMNNYSEEQIYNRLKRKSSLTFSSHCNGSIPLNISASTLTYQSTNNGNLMQSNAYRCKVQKTNNLNIPTATDNSNAQSVPSYNNTLYSNSANKSSVSSISSASSLSSSPMSPVVTPLITQLSFHKTQTESNNQSESDILAGPSSMSSIQRTSTTANTAYLPFQNLALLPDRNSKYVQEWLFTNRFSQLLHLFSNYGSNDLLRLSKDDLIKLCGAPDGIRCYNLAHNIQIKSKLTIFVTFQNCQSYFSAIFLSDWKCKYLVKRLFSLFLSYMKNLNGDKEAKNSQLTLKDEQIIDNNTHTSLTNVYSDEGGEDDDDDDDNEENIQNTNHKCDNIEKNEDNIVYKNTSIINTDDEKNSAENQNYLYLYEKMHSIEYKYELFIKHKSILIKTTEEVLNNLLDQSRFLIQFELPPVDTQSVLNNSTEAPNKNNQAFSKSLLDKDNLIKIIMIPLN